MINNYDWNHIKSFVAILDEGTLSAAAKRLNLSQPTLSRHMDELENALNVVLFERGRKGAIPTAAAFAIADHAREMEKANHALSLSAAGKGETLKGSVRITASQIVSSYLLPPIITRLLDQSPELEIEIVSSDHIENLLDRDADIALRMLPPSQMNLISKKVNEFRIGVFAHRDYLKKWGTPQNANDLKHHRILGFDRNTKIIDSFASTNHPIDRSFFRLRCDDQVVYWRSILSGAGVGFMSHYVAQQYEELIEIPGIWDIPSLPIWLVSHREVKTNRRIRQVYDFLSKNLTELEL